MKVKRYTEDTMKDVLQKVKVDLGEDAVILDVKKIKQGGFLGFFTKERVEVVAAVDGEKSAETSSSFKKQQAATSYKAQIVETPSIAHPPVTAPLDLQSSAKSPIEPQAQLDLSLKSVVPHVQKVETNTEESFLLGEVKQMKDMLSTLTKQQKSDTSSVSKYERWIDILKDQDVQPEVLDSIISSIDMAVNEDSTEEEIKQQFVIHLKQILTPKVQKAILPTTKIAHFVGPTGVGKTTTIAKLAAIQNLTYGKKVGFITADTFRMAAVEQLRNYATLLNAPIEVVFSPNDLPRAFSALSDRDIVFIDTAGRNFKNPMYVSEVNSLVQNIENRETFLVLSLTGKYKDMKHITTNFSKFDINKVIFTKMDETNTYGAMLNLVHDFPLNLSYVADGQSVPDDISEVNVDKIANLLLGD